MKAEASEGRTGEGRCQLTLDSLLVKEKKAEFSCEDILLEVAKFVACDDQVCLVTI
jgi:hypothetical protein